MNNFIFVVVAGVLATANGQFQVTLENDGGLGDFARKVVGVLQSECPKIKSYFYGQLHRDNLPNGVHLNFDKNYDGVAYASGGKITGAVNYYRQHQNDIGSFVHECVHIIQGYHGNVPGWLTEGIADYYRYYVYEHKPPGQPSRNNHYTNAYGVTAYFLDWASNNRCKGQPNLVQRLNDKAWRGQYNDHLWQEYCGGRSAQQLWDEMPKHG